METEAVIALIVGMAAVTYATRLPLLLASRPLRVPRLVDRVLDYVPIAAFSAIVFPAVLSPSGSIDVSPSNAYLFAALAAVAAAIARRNMLITLAAGMAAVIAARLVIGN